MGEFSKVCSAKIPTDCLLFLEVAAWKYMYYILSRAKSSKLEFMLSITDVIFIDANTKQ